MTAISYTSYSDGELLLFLRNGDQNAFAEIYNRYYKPVYRYLVSLVKIPQLAEDEVHEVFIKIWNIREKLEIKENFSAYLFRICHNKAVDITRRTAADRNLKDQLLHHYQTWFQDEQRSMEELQRLDAMVDDALESLSPQRRKVYDLCKRQGFTYKEAAEELQISAHTVKEYMTDALHALRKFLHARGELPLAYLLFEIIIIK